MATPNTDRQFPRRHRLSPDAYSDRSAVFHLTIRAFPETAPFVADVGEAAWVALMEQAQTNRVQVHAACLMPDHLHVVVSPEAEDIVSWVRAFKSYTTHVARRHGWRGKLWQPSFHDRALRAGELGTVVEYLRMNPVQAGLVGAAESWPWMFMSGE